MVWKLRVLRIGNPRIDKTYTRMFVKGEWKSPGEYKLSKGESVTLRGRITNEGDRANCAITFRDQITGEIIDRREGWLEKGQSM